jgi:malonate-semialdehyde dehydrogenase (acetylating)/methylmalonate-semialdehyde dehydrogenase
VSEKRLKYCVNNQWKESATQEYMPVYNTSTGEVMVYAPCCTKDEVDEAIKSAKEAFPMWSRVPVQKRVELIFRYKRIMEEHLDELATLVAQEQGKTFSEARGEVGKAIEGAELACATPVMMQGDTLMQVSNGIDTISFREPLGVFAGIAPANFPAMIPFGWMMPLCIATGNTFVLKLASKVPQTGMRIMELLIEAGVPEGVVNVMTCSRREAELFMTHPDVKGVSYVGSTKVGRHIYATAAANGKRVQVLGEAKNHALVLADCNLEKSAQVVVNSAFGAAGQRCMALPVAVVEESIADDFVALLIKCAKELKVGPATKGCTKLGPVGSKEHKQSIINWINKGIEEGAKIVLDGRKVAVEGNPAGYYLGPTILDHVKPGMTVGDEEIFGPVLCVKRVKDFDEGLALMNGNQFANGSVVFTQSGYYAREFAMRTHGGMVGVNVGIPVPTSYFPFQGHKNSFLGDLHVMGSRDGVMFYTDTKSVTTNWFSDEERPPIQLPWEKEFTKPAGCSGV